MASPYLEDAVRRALTYQLNGVPVTEQVFYDAAAAHSLQIEHIIAWLRVRLAERSGA